MKRTRHLLLLLTLILLAVPPALLMAADESQPIRVAVKESPPFVIKSDDGSWSGITVSLWRTIAQTEDIDYVFEETELEPLLQGVADGTYAVGLGAITATAERAENLDFSHPFYSTGLGIAVQKRGGWWDAITNMITWPFISAITGLSLLLLGVGFLAWLFERKKNPDQFGGNVIEGLGAGFWWSAVTMTTVGYGDKAPATPAGRLVALFWMFASIIIISSFTAAITSSLTVGSLNASIESQHDLRTADVGVIPGTTAANYANAHLPHATDYDSVDAALSAVESGEVEAVVHDAPLLQYHVMRRQSDLLVLERTFRRQDYALALTPDSPLLRAVDATILRQITGNDWQTQLERYFGRDDDG